jgi:hypothetical protein
VIDAEYASQLLSVLWLSRFFRASFAGSGLYTDANYIKTSQYTVGTAIIIFKLRAASVCS